jgi:hypothetical protein
VGKVLEDVVRGFERHGTRIRVKGLLLDHCYDFRRLDNEAFGMKVFYSILPYAMFHGVLETDKKSTLCTIRVVYPMTSLIVFIMPTAVLLILSAFELNLSGMGISLLWIVLVVLMFKLQGIVESRPLRPCASIIENR